MQPGVPTPSPQAGPQLTEPVSEDEFYRYPADLPRADPGRLVRLQALEVPAGVRGWRVLYHSTAVNGRDIVVSGVVFAPDEPADAGSRPVVAWGHGSVGLGDSCAPSRSPDHFTGQGTLSELLESGYVVAATDYEGLGTPGPHPWLVGQSEGRGVLDSVRAARQIPEAAASNRFIAFGASQGGGAVLFAGELASGYAKELELLGVVAAAPAAELDLLALLPQGNISGVAGFVIMAAFGFKAAYPDLSLDAILYPDIIAQQESVERLCQGEIGSRFRSTTVDELLKASPGETEGWSQAIVENTPGRNRTPAPVFLVHGNADQVVPVEVSRMLFQRLCGRGVVTQMQIYGGIDHGEVISASAGDVLKWIDDRTAGRDPVREGPQQLCN
ncbi:MAG TPA: lipase family protein [Actinomycetota bacterium]|nr:lipase family protein [Actinomycetota bacterium]